ncbi:hypothetical protein C8Q79DRAFT_924869 [Trametes meyenii]|nr:hypothetical protein C8Q79DRAFT_924869 [Trametes meyenii]
MTSTAVLAPHDVQTTLNYYTPIGDEAPYQYIVDTPAGREPNNLGVDTRSVVVRDARGRESEFTLDSSGFQFLKSSSAERAFDDEERIKAQYYPEVEELLKKTTGAKRVFIFDHTIRRKLPEGATEGPANRTPVERVHIDQTYQASIDRVKFHLPEDADRLLAGRVRLINVWRPIHHPAVDKPLAVSDWRHLDQNDLVPVRFIYPNREGGTYSVKYNPKHKWYYLSGQTPDEVTLIKCYDSKEDRARLTPHTAFTDTTVPKDTPHRESIEVRALVFDDE